jgi:glycerol-3-phosphate dehydrogenase (NAD(P)+)
MTFKNIAIIGGGALGTALAINLSKKLKVSLVVRTEDEAELITRTRFNSRYLPAVAIPEGVIVTANLPQALPGAQIVLIATPVSAFESVLTTVASVRKNLPIIWGCKGFGPVSGEPLSITASRILGSDACFGVFSGPSFADGLAVNDPTAVVVATNSDHETTLAIAEALSNDTLRVYANSDLIGVQICGAIKNVYAIAAGIIDGCGWGENTRAAMMTRAVAEAKRYLRRHDTKKSTLMGLSGFGDIYLTCGSRLSRNYQVGMALASNTPLATVLENLGHVAEGVHATRLILRRAAMLDVEMPIVSAVNDILDGTKTPRECAVALMARDIKHEERGFPAGRGANPSVTV